MSKYKIATIIGARPQFVKAVASFEPLDKQRDVFSDGNDGEQIVDEIVKYLDDPRPIYA